MAVIAGIDEAGFGPVLGPLVVSASAFRVPDESLDESMWRLLAGTVAKKRSKRRAVLAVADSKKLYSRQRANALEHLERGVLAMLAAAGNTPASLRQLLNALAPEALRQTERYPWYARADLPLPHCISRTDLSLAANALQVGLAGRGVSVLNLRCEVLFVGEFNRYVRATRNKSTTLFDVTSRLLMRLWRSLPAGTSRVHVDRQGGRMRYLAALQRVFGECRLRILDESDQRSAYLISDGRREMEIDFATEAEDRRLPVALASMTSKYVRELFMSLFNGFWRDRVPDLRSTAGYYVDGRRFYEEIVPAAKKLGVEDGLLYRSR